MEKSFRIITFVMETKNKTMNATNNIATALNLLNGHDWYWRMADCNFTAHYNAAKATMKQFVETVNQIESPVVREALRNLWKLNYEHASNEVNGIETVNFENRKAELMKAIA